MCCYHYWIKNSALFTMPFLTNHKNHSAHKLPTTITINKQSKNKLPICHQAKSVICLGENNKDIKQQIL